jgi:hypothetical protein
MPEHNSHGFHHGDRIDKGIQRGLHDVNCVPCPEMSGGLTSMAPLNADPHGGGFKMPVGAAPSAARPMNDMGPGLLPANGAINPNPHPYNPASQVQQRNTYAAPTWESKFK